jgi:hypothetical protein
MLGVWCAIAKARTKMIILSFLLASLLGCAQQPSSGEEASSQLEQNPKLGQEFALKYGQEVTLKDEELRVRFASVTSDSRCPSNPKVNCVWEGYAQIVARLSKDGQDAASVKLNTPNPLQEKYPSGHNYLGYTIKLVALDPYPRTTGGIEATKYVATLVIARR